jgi:hypothetical protein
MKMTPEQEAAYAAHQEAVAKRLAEEVYAARKISEESVAQRDARHAAEISAATAAAQPTPEQRKAARLQLERDNVAVQDWMVSEPRYPATTESAAAIWNASKQLQLSCTVENLATAFEFCLKHKLITAKEVPVEKRPPTLLEWAAAKGITRESIQRTPRSRLQELMKDDTYRRAVVAVSNQRGQ